MLAFDTNYLVRHLVQDEPKQCAEVAKVFQREVQDGRSILITDIVLCETVWVLQSAYAASRADILSALKALQDEPSFRFENLKRVAKAIVRFTKGKVDFPDALILEAAHESGAKLMTFDKRLLKES